MVLCGAADSIAVPVENDGVDEDQFPAVLVARDLGTDPEAWRKAMREWTENGNKPTTPQHARTDRRKCPHRSDGDTSACDHCCMSG